MLGSLAWIACAPEAVRGDAALALDPWSYHRWVHSSALGRLVLLTAFGPRPDDYP